MRRFLVAIAFVLLSCSQQEHKGRQVSADVQEGVGGVVAQPSAGHTAAARRPIDPSNNAHAAERTSATVKKRVRKHSEIEAAEAHGYYVVTCIGKCGGTGGWTDTIPNVVTTVGKNLALDTYLAGSSYTVVGPYLGLISSTSFSAVAAADTMTSHAGWLEAGNANAPTYTAPRKTVAWSAASAGSKATSSALSYAITGSGTVKGCFLVYGTGALSTIDNTAGTLYSAGLFSGGDKVVSSGDTLNVTYTASL